MPSHLPDPASFLTHTVALSHPETAAIRDAFIRLPKRGSIEVQCRWDRRLEAAQTLADAGAFAINIRPLPEFSNVTITALKGKVGACFETGRHATYTGAAAGVMDDDHHLIAPSIRVCEKTGGLYTLPPYRFLLTVTEGDPTLLERLETNPVSFDCNTFEQDADHLAARAFTSLCCATPVPVFYPGPFSLLVLQDGTILRRGHCSTIAEPLVKDLQTRDGLLILPPHRAGEATPPANYPSAYCGQGAACLLLAIPSAPASQPCACTCTATPFPPAEPLPPSQALTLLARSSEALRQRLLRLIEANEPYFILTGSDPDDCQGCCPNTQVGEANHLVQLGLLSRYQETAGPDSCTATLYAFADEITIVNHRPEFSINKANRDSATAALKHQP